MPSFSHARSNTYSNELEAMKGIPKKEYLEAMQGILKEEYLAFLRRYLKS
jgi:hypothetical protein